MHGVDAGRLAMVLAVLERRCRVPLYNRDVYVSSVGGAKITDPSADLAAALSVASAAQWPGRAAAAGRDRRGRAWPVSCGGCPAPTAG